MKGEHSRYPFTAKTQGCYLATLRLPVTQSLSTAIKRINILSKVSILSGLVSIIGLVSITGLVSIIGLVSTTGIASAAVLSPSGSSIPLGEFDYQLISTSSTDNDFDLSTEMTGFNDDYDIMGDSLESDCSDDCDDIDAVVNEHAIEEIDDDSIIDPLDDDDSDYNDTDLSIGVEHVPLNAISPETIETFVEVIDVIRHDYVHVVNDETLFQHAITGMLDKLDSHAEYLTPENYEHLRNFTDGEIGQVGLSVIYDYFIHAWVVNEVADQSSAKEEGIKIGDKLLRIKRADLSVDMSSQDITQLLSGIAGSQVQVTVANEQGIKRNVLLQRNLSTDNKLIVTVQDTIAIIKLPVFQNGSKNQIIKALQQIGVPITGVVIDVRNNPGGVLSSAIDIASLFIADGGLIQVRNRTNHSQIINPNGTPYLSDLPVVILQNRYSASAAEVLASSFQSNDRALIIGEQSFGKGTVQEVVPLKAGGALKLTVAEYRSSKGTLIDGVGVKPDIELAHDGADWQQKAIALLLAKERPLGIKLSDKLNNISVIDDY